MRAMAECRRTEDYLGSRCRLQRHTKDYLGNRYRPDYRILLEALVTKTLEAAVTKLAYVNVITDASEDAEGDLVPGRYSSGRMIPIMEWSIRNLTEGVDWEAKRLDVVSKRLSGRLCRRIRERVCNSFKGKIFKRGNWYMFGNEGSVEASGSFGTSGSSVDKLSISLTDLWEQAMFEVTSLWEKSDVVFWSGYQREIKGYEVDVQGCEGVTIC
ncbi:hypothetical protein Tco_1184977 [Tanacetum coccineum]